MHANYTSNTNTHTGQNTYVPLTTLAGSNDGSGGKGQDIHLKVQEQLFDNAKKAKDASQSSGGGPKGFRKFSKDFLNKLQSLSGNKEANSLQAGIASLAVVTGKVAMVELDQSPVDVDVTGSVVAWHAWHVI